MIMVLWKLQMRHSEHLLHVWRLISRKSVPDKWPGYVHISIFHWIWWEWWLRLWWWWIKTTDDNDNDEKTIAYPTVVVAAVADARASAAAVISVRMRRMSGVWRVVQSFGTPLRIAAMYIQMLQTLPSMFDFLEAASTLNTDADYSAPVMDDVKADPPAIVSSLVVRISAYLEIQQLWDCTLATLRTDRHE